MGKADTAARKRAQRNGRERGCRVNITADELHDYDEPGLSAYVLDTFNCHRVVGTFRSETRIPRPVARGGFVDGPVQGREGAVRGAERLAAFLNAHDGRAARDGR